MIKNPIHVFFKKIYIQQKANKQGASCINVLKRVVYQLGSKLHYHNIKVHIIKEKEDGVVLI